MATLNIRVVDYQPLLAVGEASPVLHAHVSGVPTRATLLPIARGGGGEISLAIGDGELVYGTGGALLNHLVLEVLVTASVDNTVGLKAAGAACLPLSVVLAAHQLQPSGTFQLPLIDTAVPDVSLSGQWGGIGKGLLTVSVQPRGGVAKAVRASAILAVRADSAAAGVPRDTPPLLGLTNQRQRAYIQRAYSFYDGIGASWPALEVFHTPYFSAPLVLMAGAAYTLVQPSAPADELALRNLMTQALRQLGFASAGDWAAALAKRAGVRWREALQVPFRAASLWPTALVYRRDTTAEAGGRRLLDTERFEDVLLTGIGDCEGLAHGILLTLRAFENTTSGDPMLRAASDVIGLYVAGLVLCGVTAPQLRGAANQQLVKGWSVESQMRQRSQQPPAHVYCHAFPRHMVRASQRGDGPRLVPASVAVEPWEARLPHVFCEGTGPQDEFPGAPLAEAATTERERLAVQERERAFHRGAGVVSAAFRGLGSISFPRTPFVDTAPDFFTAPEPLERPEVSTFLLRATSFYTADPWLRWGVPVLDCALVRDNRTWGVSFADLLHEPERVSIAGTAVLSPEDFAETEQLLSLLHPSPQLVATREDAPAVQRVAQLREALRGVRGMGPPPASLEGRPVGVMGAPGLDPTRNAKAIRAAVERAMEQGGFSRCWLTSMPLVNEIGTYEISFQ